MDLSKQDKWELLKKAAIAMNKGELEQARKPVERMETVQHPMLKAVAARYYFHFEETGGKARGLLADALSMLDGRDDPFSRYVREYCKTFLVDFAEMRFLNEQIKIALAALPDEQTFHLLPLFEDLDCLEDSD
ncbi:MAG: hypothetical protein AAFN04_09020 [Pseudomonadota bacterium]